jgi:formamidopyrimidine-DNA glycosylase
MPELPEVETVVRGLRRMLTGARIESVAYASTRVNRANHRNWKSQLAGKEIIAVDRRGKYIILRLSGEHAVVAHLRMTGRLWIKNAPYRRDIHDRLIVLLSTGQYLVLNDSRQFARFDWCAPGTLSNHPGLAKLGPEAPELTAAEFHQICRRSQRPVKALLLDQTRLTGLGNIYADESLFKAGIRPTTPTSSLSPRRTARLHAAIQSILARAIKACGTTVDTFSDVEGSSGGFAPFLMVYRRTGEPCRVCNRPIRRIQIAGRGTHYCGRCQKR